MTATRPLNATPDTTAAAHRARAAGWRRRGARTTDGGGTPPGKVRRLGCAAVGAHGGSSGR